MFMEMLKDPGLGCTKLWVCFPYSQLTDQQLLGSVSEQSGTSVPSTFYKGN